MRCKTLCALLLLLPLCHDSLATHLRAGEIQVRRIDCSALTFEITLFVYININSNVNVGGEDDYISFGDGTSALVPSNLSYDIIDDELGIALVKYTILHTYNSFGKYNITYREPNRNFEVLNYSGIAQFFLETSILIEPANCNTSLVLLIPPIDRACSGITFFHNPGAFDEDLDSLSFSLVVPQQSEASPLSLYKFPNDELFYSVTPYNAANEAKTGPPVFAINETDGTVTWDAPGLVGEYVIAFKVTEWKFRKSDNTWYEAGYIIRDMQIIVEECENRKPLIDMSEAVCVTAGSFINFEAQAFDPDADSVLIEHFSDVFGHSENTLVISPANRTILSTQGPDNARINLQWQTGCADIREESYKIIFKISDRPHSGPRLTRFYTLHIKVIAPAPEFTQVSVNPVSKNATIEWTNYPCDNVKSFQVWRRISSLQYVPELCQTGMPYFLRYQLLEELPGDFTAYTDNNLAFGTQYCYRIMALVGENKTASRLSLDTCFIPKPAEAPVITNVTVQNTDSQNGKILIRWTHPFDIDAIQYPAPYTYSVLRKNDSDAESVFEKITSATIGDTIFTDTNINTHQNIYRYKIELYVPALTEFPVDTSSQASSVFASTKSSVDAIDLTWISESPWSNYAESDPYHLIFRATSPDGPFILIDSVNVHTEGFQYVDRGQYNGMALSNDRYYYKLKTRGTYGNPRITSPLENFSQITGGQILDTIPPCKPILSVAKIDCQEFACDGSDYYTKLEWTKPGIDCDADVSYEILVKHDSTSLYTSIAQVTENQFIHSNLPSLNQCYRLISTDRAGNQSDTSDVVCNSNCVRFQLPNIITPGISDGNNDVLTTFPDHENYQPDCSRSVKQVNLKIYSRWGTEIFTASVTSVDSPVFWNGRNADGTQVSEGTYFYHAQVTFDTNDPTQETQEIKGWVQVLR